MARNPKKSKTSVPLLCSLCPKTPTFSDISHLLTHISSKSHLSHRFKLQIRSQGEPEARQILDTFETWYAEHGLEDLLSDRMASKDKKGDVIKKPRASNTAESKAKSKPKKSLKTEQPDLIGHSQSGAYHAPVPQMHTWSTTDSVVTKLDPTTEQTTVSTMYTTPKINRQLPGFSPHGSPEEEPSTPHTSSRSEAIMDRTEVDPSKLKGVYWPGMSLFDSATDLMKRRRNQKKDKSVLSQMILTSEAVEPNELIFTPAGNLQRSRYIYASPTESSPGRSDTEPTPKKPRAKRAPLANLSTNGPRRSKETSKTTRGARKRDHALADLDTDPYANYGMANPLIGMHQFVASAEEEEEFSLAVENITKKRGFSIFRDEEVASPGRTESPLEEARFDFPDAMHMAPMIFRPVKLSPAKVPKAIAPRSFSNKKNKQIRGFYQGGPSAHGFPPRMFHDHTSNPLAPISHAHSFSFEDHPVLKESKASESSFHGAFVPLSDHKERKFNPVNSVKAKLPATFDGQVDHSLYHH